MSRWVASAGGLGYAPVAPGTIASAIAAVAGVALLRLSPWALAIGALVATVVGVVAIRRLGPELAASDPGWVVIDEVAGQWIAMFGVAGWLHVWWGTLAAFALFRAFDIAKPGPVGWIDSHHGAVPVMADDVLAGALAATALLVWRLA